MKSATLIIRFFIFTLDILLFSFLTYFTIEFFKEFTEPQNITNLSLIIISVYSLLYISIEYFFNGSIFKIFFGLRCVTENGEKLSFLMCTAKFFLRFIALIIGFFYFYSLLILILIIIRIFGGLINYYNMAGDFLHGRMKNVWYDKIIKQEVIYKVKQ